MCEPISWVERDGECYFVTSADLKSEKGKELLKDARHNDPLGHGFVRLYWNIPTGVGKDYEVQEFWKPSKYPKDIRVTLGKNFDRNWGHIWQYATNIDLRYIVEYGTEKYKEKAWEALLSKATNIDLRYIVEYGTEKYKEKAQKELKGETKMSKKIIYECDRCGEKTEDGTEIESRSIISPLNKPTIHDETITVDLCKKCNETLNNSINILRDKYNEDFNKMIEAFLLKKYKKRKRKMI